MRDGHYLLTDDPSSLFILLGWGSIPVASLHLLLLLRRMRCPWSLLYSVTADFCGWYSRIWLRYSLTLPRCNKWFVKCHTRRGRFRPWILFTGLIKLANFVDGRTTVLILCLDGTPLMWLKIFWTKGRRPLTWRPLQAAWLPAAIGWEPDGSVPCYILSPGKFFWMRSRLSWWQIA
jgi:hypothetical protein